MLDVLAKALAIFLGSGTLLAVLVVYKIKQIRSKYKHIPGPRSNSSLFGVVNEVLAYKEKRGSFSGLVEQWHNEIGPTFVAFYIHQPMVWTVDSAAIKEVMIDGNCPKPWENYSRVYALFGERFLGRGLVSETDHDAWARRRAVLNPAFHKKFLKAMMGEFNNTGDEMIDSLSKLADGKTKVNLTDYLHRATLDVIGKVAFSKDIGSMNDSESRFTAAIFKCMLGAGKAVLDTFWKLKPWANRRFRQEVGASCRFLRGEGREWLEERQEAMARGDGVPEDFLTLVIRAHEQDAEGFGIEEIVDDFVTLFVAGQETTANTLGFALMELGRNQDVMQKLKSEIDSVLGSKQDITYEDLGKLEYTGMVFKEALRLYSVAPITFRKLTKDTDIGGYMVPTGTVIAINLYSIGRYSQFHEEALTFRPERFLKENANRPNTYTFIPFSLGSRNCIGQNFAQMEGKVLLAKFVQNFNLQLDMTQSFEMSEDTTIRPKDSVRCSLSPRTEEMFF